MQIVSVRETSGSEVTLAVLTDKCVQAAETYALEPNTFTDCDSQMYLTTSDLFCGLSCSERKTFGTPRCG